MSIGTNILKRRLGAKDIILHLARIDVEGELLYSHNPHNRNLDIYENKHVVMVPYYVNDFYKSNLKDPEDIKIGREKVIMVPLITKYDEKIGVMEIKCPDKKVFSNTDIEEIEYYSEAFVSIIDDYRKQKQQLGYMRDQTGLIILLMMWTLFFMSLAIIYSFSPSHYNLIFFIALFFILSSVFIIFEEHLYTLKGWGIDMPTFLKDLPFYIGISTIVCVLGGVIKWFGWFGVDPMLGGSFLVFNWTWRDILYPITVPLQEMAARVLPHTILGHVLKGWHKPITIVLISSAVFGFSHISFGFTMMVFTFLLGIVLGSLFEYKRNFWGICLVHMIVGYITMTGLGYELYAILPVG